jgi:hypothetical protein
MTAPGYYPSPPSILGGISHPGVIQDPGNGAAIAGGLGAVLQAILQRHALEQQAAAFQGQQESRAADIDETRARTGLYGAQTQKALRPDNPEPKPGHIITQPDGSVVLVDPTTAKVRRCTRAEKATTRPDQPGNGDPRHRRQGWATRRGGERVRTGVPSRAPGQPQDESGRGGVLCVGPALRVAARPDSREASRSQRPRLASVRCLRDAGCSGGRRAWNLIATGRWRPIVTCTAHRRGETDRPDRSQLRQMVAGEEGLHPAGVGAVSGGFQHHHGVPAC